MKEPSLTVGATQEPLGPVFSAWAYVSWCCGCVWAAGGRREDAPSKMVLLSART